MADSINLYQEGKSSSNSGGLFNNSLLMVCITLLIIGVVYGVFSWMTSSAEAETMAAQEEANRYLAEIDNETLQSVNDAYLRIVEFSKREEKEVVVLNQLRAVETTIVPESLVTEYSYDVESDAQSMNVSIESDFLDGASKQLAAFRNSERFDSIQTTSLILGENGMTAQFILSSSSAQ